MLRLSKRLFLKRKNEMEIFEEELLSKFDDVFK